MSIAVIYYSMSGNTDYVAQYIQSNIGADLIRIEPKKEYPNKGFSKFFWGGKSAVMGEEPELEEYSFDSDKYDLVIFGTPIWAGRFTPPIRTFINENKEKLHDKKIAAFVCSSGGNGTNAIQKLKEFIEIEEFAAELSLVDPKEKKEVEKDKQIDEFCKKLI